MSENQQKKPSVIAEVKGYPTKGNIYYRIYLNSKKADTLGVRDSDKVIIMKR